MRTMPREGSALARSYLFRPPDPTWASSKLMAEVRASLAAFDPYVTVWWSETRRLMSDEERPGRWRVMEWMPRLSNWAEVFTWETQDKRYLPPWPTSGITQRLLRGRVRMDLAARLADEHTARVMQAQQSEFRSNCEGYIQDIAERAVGSRATPRSILHATSVTQDGLKRRRAAAIGGMFREKRELSNHEKYLIEHFKKQAGGA